MGILERLTDRQVITHDQLQFVDATPFSNRIEKDLIKFHHIPLSQRDLVLQGQFSHGVHDLGNIDIFLAANGTGLAGGADPDG